METNRAWRVVLQVPISPTCDVSLSVNGRLTQRGVEHLLAYCELLKDHVLTDAEAELAAFIEQLPKSAKWTSEERSRWLAAVNAWIEMSFDVTDNKTE